MELKPGMTVRINAPHDGYNGRIATLIETDGIRHVVGLPQAGQLVYFGANIIQPAALGAT